MTKRKKDTKESGPTELSRKIAIHCGWEQGPETDLACGFVTIPRMRMWHKKGEEHGWVDCYPHYASDLNAMAEAINALTPLQKAVYRNYLIGACEGMGSRNWAAIDATALQRAEAFVYAIEAKEGDES